MIEEADFTYYDTEEIPREAVEKLNEAIRHIQFLEKKLLSEEEINNIS